MKHLLGIGDLGRDGIVDLLGRAANNKRQIESRALPPATRGGKTPTVVSLFFEDSTRTRMSFDIAVRNCGFASLDFVVATSSLSKGESVRDTVQTIEAMGADVFVVRHKSPGVPMQISRWVDVPIVNAGDGAHEHPTQALLDCFTLCEALVRQDLDGVRISMVGDILHSRVARSCIDAFAKLGAEVTLVAPRTLLPPGVETWNVAIATGIDDVMMKSDVIYLLRIQNERIDQALFPSVREFTALYGLTEERARRLDPAALIMHPGPMNRGVEVAASVADSAQSLITRQVTNGIPVRMAVLQEVLRGV